jgi:lipopolysaccharide/colanic/teichoic acid biosynthesis glycosyltransferase
MSRFQPLSPFPGEMPVMKLVATIVKSMGPVTFSQSIRLNTRHTILRLLFLGVLFASCSVGGLIAWGTSFIVGGNEYMAFVIIAATVFLLTSLYLRLLRDKPKPLSIGSIARDVGYTSDPVGKRSLSFERAGLLTETAIEIVELFIVRELKEVTRDYVDSLLEAIRDRLDIDDEIQVVAIRPGSTYMDLAMDPMSAERLLWAAKQSRFEDFDVADARIADKEGTNTELTVTQREASGSYADDKSDRAQANSRCVIIYDLIKVAWDLAVGSLCVAILAPLMIGIAIIIKVTSRGPVCYAQIRIGRNGVPFRMYKFRTMFVDAPERLNEFLEQHPELIEEWQNTLKVARDPRVTPIGRFLRRAGLDELPQLFNVLSGNMSLVGPRPVLAYELREYPELQKSRLRVRPGIACAFVLESSRNMTYLERLRSDVWYVENRNVWTDIMILFMTVRYVVRGD